MSGAIFHTTSARRCLSMGVPDHAAPQRCQMPTQLHPCTYTKKGTPKGTSLGWWAANFSSIPQPSLLLLLAKLKLSLNKGKWVSQRIKWAKSLKVSTLSLLIIIQSVFCIQVLHSHSGKKRGRKIKRLLCKTTPACRPLPSGWGSCVSAAHRSVSGSKHPVFSI